MNRAKPYWWMFILLALIINACGTALPASTPTPTIVPTSTVSPLPTLTPTEASTATPLPTATPIPNPLEITAMRARNYPGSDIVIEKTLDPGVNYRRYYVSYRSEGLKIYALMTVPNGEKPPTGWPVIIFNHGYIPPDVYRTTERYVAYVDLIARSGYIVFRSDYRGHAKSEGEARGAYGYPDYTVDVLNAVASMKRYPDADPNRIGMWGHSMGGYLTLRSMVITGDIKAGVIWGGVVAPYPDLFTRWNPGGYETAPAPGSWVYGLEQAYGTPQQNPGFWNSISANAYLRDLNGPIQLHHATTDEEVPVEFSEMLYNGMQEAGQPVEF